MSITGSVSDPPNGCFGDVSYKVNVLDEVGEIREGRFVSLSGFLNAVAVSGLEFPRPAGYVATEASAIYVLV